MDLALKMGGTILSCLQSINREMNLMNWPNPELWITPGMQVVLIKWLLGKITWFPWNLSFRYIHLYWSIHTKDESKRGTVFAFIFGVNWLWRCGVTASFEFFFHEIKCNGMTSFMEFMQCVFTPEDINLHLSLILLIFNVNTRLSNMQPLSLFFLLQLF